MNNNLFFMYNLYVLRQTQIDLIIIEEEEEEKGGKNNKMYIVWENTRLQYRTTCMCIIIRNKFISFGNIFLRILNFILCHTNYSIHLNFNFVVFSYLFFIPLKFNPLMQ